MKTIETERLLLRPFAADDLDEFALLCADPDVMRFIGNGMPQSRAQAETRVNAVVKHWNEHGFGLVGGDYKTFRRVCRLLWFAASRQHRRRSKSDIACEAVLGNGPGYGSGDGELAIRV